MTKRPRKTKLTESRGLLVLRNRLIVAVVVMAAAGVLLWRPWAPSGPTVANRVVAVAPAPAPVPKPPQKPAAIATTAAAPAEPAPSPAFTTASITPAAPLPPSPPPASRMSASLEADFDAWLIDAYRACWSPPGAAPDGDIYYPRVRISLKADGTLAGPPKLVNPPWDPAWKPHADAAVKAVKACDPLKVPEKYAPYYTQWKLKTVFFDPTRS
jgi:hypothetical protein